MQVYKGNKIWKHWCDYHAPCGFVFYFPIKKASDLFLCRFRFLFTLPQLKSQDIHILTVYTIHHSSETSNQYTYIVKIYIISCCINSLPYHSCYNVSCLKAFRFWACLIDYYYHDLIQGLATCPFVQVQLQYFPKNVRTYGIVRGEEANSSCAYKTASLGPGRHYM